MMISSNEVHLWYLFDEQISDPALLLRYHRLLNEEETKRQKRFFFKKYRHQYLVTRALMRCVLSFYVDEILPQEWQFYKNRYGKPYINDFLTKHPLQFNLSHTDKMAVMAVTFNNDIGVDVEYVHRRKNMVELVENYFSPIEVKHLRDLSEDYQRNRFFELWTLKEAYIKACGMGLSIPLNQFSYIFTGQGKISILFEPERNDQPEKWQFWHICPNQCHRVSVALKKDKINTSYFLSMRRIVPLVDIQTVDYPIMMDSALPA